MGPLAGLGEMFTANFCGFAAVACLVLILAGVLRVLGSMPKAAEN
jgi:hypothetical protein